MSKGRVILNTVSIRPDGPNRDAFGRIRQGSPFSLFESALLYDLEHLLWNTISVGGTLTYLPNESAAQLGVGTGATDALVRQSKKYCPYFPGKGQLIACTGILGSPKANVVKRIGYFDDNDGVFFELDETGLSLVVRSSATGSVVEERVRQSDWNMDKVDGTGPSGITLDSTKTQIFFIDFQWLGVGSVRFGFSFGDGPTYVHESKHANVLDKVYMSRGTLPVRYEIRNTGVTVSPTSDLKQICSSVATEAGAVGDFPVRTSTGSNNGAGAGVTLSASEVPIVSFRPKETFNSKPNRAYILPLDFSAVLVGTNDIAKWTLYYSPTINDSAWVDAGTDSISEYNIDATTVSGGVAVASGFILTGGSVKVAVSEKTTSNTLVAARSIDGSSSDIYTLTMQAEAGGTPKVYAAVTWKEHR